MIMNNVIATIANGAVMNTARRREADFKKSLLNSAHDNFEHLFGAKLSTDKQNKLLDAIDDMLHSGGRS